MDIDTVLGNVKANWGWILALGILFFILGIIGFGMVFTLTITTTIFFGGFVLAGGKLQFIHAFNLHSAPYFVEKSYFISI